MRMHSQTAKFSDIDDREHTLQYKSKQAEFTLQAQLQHLNGAFGVASLACC